MKKIKFQKIVENELKSFNITYKQEVCLLDKLSNDINDIEHLENYIERKITLTTIMFYKLNTILLALKKQILEDIVSKTRKEIIETTFGKSNGNNIHSLFEFIHKNSNIQFNENFVFYTCIIETLFRHQMSHGFLGSIYRFLDNFPRKGLLLYNQQLWKRYIVEESNDNLFFTYTPEVFDTHNFIHSAYPNVFLNSHYTRQYFQLHSFEDNNSYKDKIYELYLTNQLSYDVVLRDYQIEYLKCENIQQQIFTKLTFLQNNPKEQKLVKTLCFGLMNRATLFLDKNKMQENIRILYKNIRLLNQTNVSKITSDILLFISNVNYETMKHVFDNASKKFKLNSTKKLSYVVKKIEDIFSITTSEKEISEFYNELLKKHKNIPNDEIFKYFFDKKRMFSSYIFTEHSYIPIYKQNIEIGVLNKTSNIVINYEIFFEKMNKEIDNIMNNLSN